jgi:tetratricopeptide (TPR) repeat protein
MSDRASIDSDIARGEAMEREDPEGAIAFLEALAVQHTDDARVLFAYAGALDYAGREAEAVGPYRRAREQGLPDELLPRWYVQLGSTLRNLGEHAQAVALLAEGQQAFPEDAAIGCFLALAQQSAGDPARALRTALEVVLAADREERIDLRGYRRALGWYAADLTGDATD